ncbi:MAG: aminotransferase class I/II-fold pyridoxal phosphate-dependent enzyme [Ignisphaera sp.]
MLCIASLYSYRYKEPPQQAIRLHLNECLYPLPDIIVENISKVLRNCNLYPSEVMFTRFRELIAEYVKVDVDNVYPFAGGDSALRTIFYTLINSGDKVMYVEPTFVMVKVYAKNRKVKELVVESREGDEWWITPLDTLLEKSKNVDTAIIIDPNNPTGSPIVKAKKDIVGLLSKSVRKYIVFDEAYHEFAGYTVANYISDYPNIVVVRSLSKAFCLAGFRLGYVIASKDIIAKISSVHTPFDIPTPSIAAGITALENRKYMEDMVNEVKTVRELMYEKLKSMGFKVYRSLANFLLIKDKRDLQEVLSRYYIYIKKIGEDLYRITVPPMNIYDYVIKYLGKSCEDSYTK